MSKAKFGLSFNARKPHVNVIFNTRKEREELLLLLNKVQFDATISLFEKREETNNDK
ncbi:MULTISPECIES: hypothetical protein [Virgibacillus]|uniref:hypothetical protein n=1 Tax=Virgibacillus TaxID=84406 RepID=UPI0003884EBD|nr:hypothetical protein [Virgibacillus sp. CM-4]EQB35018.1 hypothetical protein M948_18100 [Virgibacillus sp. CM-4]